MKLLLATTPYLLAARDVFRDMGSGFREKREAFDPTDLLIWIAVIAGLCAVLAWLSRVLARDKRQSFNSPRALFRSLSKTHGLDHAQRKLLKQIARHHKVTHVARLFLEPEWFDVETLSPALQQRRQAIEAVRATLFATEEPDAIRFKHSADEAAAEPEPALAAAAESGFTGLPVELPATYGPLRYEQRVRD